jgi:hypothetical protein
LAASLDRLCGARLLRTLLPKLKKIAPGFLADAVRKSTGRIAKFSAINKLARLARSHAPARVSHRGSEEITVDGRVAWRTRLVSYKLGASGAGRNRKQPCRLKNQRGRLKNQRAEYITAAPRKTIDYEAASMPICESQE